MIIVFEGPDMVGKTTIINEVQLLLKSRYPDKIIKTIAFPNENDQTYNEIIRLIDDVVMMKTKLEESYSEDEVIIHGYEYILKNLNLKLTDTYLKNIYKISLLFDRFNEKNTIYLLDRYIDSTFVYGVARKDFTENEFKTLFDKYKFPTPDILFKVIFNSDYAIMGSIDYYLRKILNDVINHSGDLDEDNYPASLSKIRGKIETVRKIINKLGYNNENEIISELHKLGSLIPDLNHEWLKKINSIYNKKGSIISPYYKYTIRNYTGDNPILLVPQVTKELYTILDKEK